MQLPEICIKRPVFATVLSLIILLIGLISYTRLSVREYPRIDEPVVSVNTTYRGASAESGSRFSVKRTLIREVSERLCEVISSTPSMPASESSSTLVTCDSTTSADAPR